MAEITVTTQAEFDALPAKFDEWTYVYIKSDRTVQVVVNRRLENSSVVAQGNSSVAARGNSSVVAWGNSSVVARGNSSVVARENSSVVAWGNSSVVAWENSSVVAWENSSVVARENSSVAARGNSSVVAWENSSVAARENSSVAARGNSSVVARENSSVVAWGNSSVVAWENSSVVAWGNSSVVAWGSVCVRVHSDAATVLLFAFAVAFAYVKAKIQKKSKTATIITPNIAKGLAGWLENNAVKDNASLVLFKRVSKDFLTQEGQPWETKWEVGLTLKHPNYKPESGECGAGKYHACSRAYFCDEFRSTSGDRYVAIKIAKKNVYAWPSPDYPHKIGFGEGTVLYECDRFGRKVGA